MYIRYLGNRSNIARDIKNELEIKSKALNKPVDISDITMLPTEQILSTIEVEADKLGFPLDMIRIPKNKPIDIEINEGEVVDIYIAKYKCNLISKNGIKFIDNDGFEHMLTLDENKIGRGKACNVKFGSDLREISRVHLLIVNYNHKKLQITDLSAQGSYLPKRFYDQ